MPIEVNETSKLAKALQLHPDVLDYIVSLNPHDFNRLRNPLMRRLMPPRITLARIAKMTNTPIVEMLVRIHETAGRPLTEEERKELSRSVEDTAEGDLASNQDTAPDWIQQKVAVTIDLLESDARLDADPMTPIMKSLKRLAPDDVMVVKHKWEPQPLYDIWEKTGVDHWATQHGEDEWWIFVRKKEVTT